MIILAMAEITHVVITVALVMAQLATMPATHREHAWKTRVQLVMAAVTTQTHVLAIMEPSNWAMLAVRHQLLLLLHQVPPSFCLLSHFRLHSSKFCKTNIRIIHMKCIREIIIFRIVWFLNTMYDLKSKVFKMGV